jgi:hypothetical protein
MKDAQKDRDQHRRGDAANLDSFGEAAINGKRIERMTGSQVGSHSIAWCIFGTVIRPNPKDQITCGRTSLKSISGVIFSKPRLSIGNAADLQMDVQVPIPSKKRPSLNWRRPNISDRETKKLNVGGTRWGDS